MLTAAIAAADAGSFGAADGLAVLVLEEALKARVLFAPLFALKTGATLGVTDDLLRRLLYGPQAHFLRHVMGAWQVIQASVAKDGRDPFRPQLSEDDIAAIDRFMTANHRKGSGFYVDFSAKGWSTPERISQDDWTASRIFAEQVVAETMRQATDARGLLD